MASATLTGAPLVTDVVLPRQYTTVWCKANWGDPDWLYMVRLKPMDAQFVSFPQTGRATFERPYGPVQGSTYMGEAPRRGELLLGGGYLEPFAPYNFLDIVGCYVAIWLHTIDGDFLHWCGVITSEQRRIEGYDDYTGAATGVQVWTAQTLDYLLDRQTILGTYTDNAVGGEYIDQTRAFNKQMRGGELTGNGSTARDSSLDCYLFSSDGEVWSNKDIAEYLVACFTPNDGPTFFLTGQPETLTDIYREFDPRGMTLKEALASVLDRRRGVCTSIWTDGDRVEIQVLSISSEVYADEYVYLPANPYQLDFQVDDSVHINAVTGRSLEMVYDYIIVEAEEPVHLAKTFSFSETPDPSLEEGWTTAEEEDYEDADDPTRGRELLRYVYSYFRVPDDYDLAALLPTFDDWGEMTPASGDGTIFRNDLRFASRLPWYDEPLHADVLPDRTEPFGLIIDPDESIYIFLHRLAEADRPHLSLRLSDRELGIWVQGRPAHIIAASQFALAAEDTDTDPVFDYETLEVTLAVITDTIPRIRIRVADGVGTETGKTLVIRVPGVRVAVAAANTIKDVDENGDEVYWGDGVGEDTDIIINEMDKLQSIARLAWAWYGQERTAVQIVVKNLLPWFLTGDLVRSTGQSWYWEPAGTVVTTVRYDYSQQIQEVHTGYPEMDPAEFGELFHQ